MEWTYEGVMKIAMEGVNEDMLNAGDDKEVKKFRMNIGNMMRVLFSESPEEKVKGLQVLKAAAFGFIGQLPVITPVITAMLQVVTGDDLGSKIDDIGRRMDESFREMDERADQRHREVMETSEQRHREVMETSEQRHREMVELMKKGFGDLNRDVCEVKEAIGK